MAPSDGVTLELTPPPTVDSVRIRYGRLEIDVDGTGHRFQVRLDGQPLAVRWISVKLDVNGLPVIDVGLGHQMFKVQPLPRP